MRFERDPRKDAANREKHGVSLELACRVFDDPNAMLLVAHTCEDQDGEEVIISARKAKRAERKRYDERA